MDRSNNTVVRVGNAVFKLDKAEIRSRIYVAIRTKEAL